MVQFVYDFVHGDLQSMHLLLLAISTSIFRHQMASGLEEIARFGTADYVVFVGLLATSLVIGLFHAFTGNRNPEEYLFGGRSMSVLPVSISLLSSYISAIAVLGEFDSE